MIIPAKVDIQEMRDAGLIDKTPRCCAPFCGDKIQDEEAWFDGAEFYHIWCCDQFGIAQPQGP